MLQALPYLFIHQIPVIVKKATIPSFYRDQWTFHELYSTILPDCLQSLLCPLPAFIASYWNHTCRNLSDYRVFFSSWKPIVNVFQGGWWGAVVFGNCKENSMCFWNLVSDSLNWEWCALSFEILVKKWNIRNLSPFKIEVRIVDLNDCSQKAGVCRFFSERSIDDNDFEFFTIVNDLRSFFFFRFFHWRRGNWNWRREFGLELFMKEGNDSHVWWQKDCLDCIFPRIVVLDCLQILNRVPDVLQRYEFGVLFWEELFNVVRKLWNHEIG